MNYRALAEGGILGLALAVCGIHATTWRWWLLTLLSLSLIALAKHFPGKSR